MFPESKAMWGIFKLVSGGAVGGLVLAASAVESSPALTTEIPATMGGMTYTLVVAVLALVMRNYMPSEKKVDQQYVSLKAGHDLLLKKLEDFAFGRNTKDIELATQLSAMDTKLDRAIEDIAHTRHLVDHIERRGSPIHDSGETRRPNHA